MEITAGVLSTVIGGLILCWLTAEPTQRQPPPPPIVINEHLPADVSIESVDFSRQAHSQTRWGITSRRDYFFGFTIRLKNSTGSEFQSCQMVYECGTGTHHASSGPLVLQSWRNYEPTKALGVFFTLTGNRLTSLDMISWPQDSEMQRPEWLRVRAANSNGFATPWFNVDLSKSE